MGCGSSSVSAETASRISAPEWDAVSGSDLKRKLRPGIEPQGGTHFPVEAWDGKSVPESGQFGGQVVERAERAGIEPSWLKTIC